jgi:enoyl-CoA hydratase/carnithine racemase
MSEILSHREAGVLTLTFNRLDKKNAITTAMYSELARRWKPARTTTASAWPCSRARSRFSPPAMTWRTS